MPISVDTIDESHMQLALSLARTAAALDEVPVGAVIVDERGLVIGTGYNRREEQQSAISHAEIEAISAACALRQSWRLQDCTLYVTLEPCLMCAGALYQSRISKVVFGASDPKGGALGSLYRIHEDTRLNHTFTVMGGILEQECASVLKDFFKAKRT